MKDDILNYLPTDMFRGTPCRKQHLWMANQIWTIKMDINVIFFIWFDTTCCWMFHVNLLDWKLQTFLFIEKHKENIHKARQTTSVCNIKFKLKQIVLQGISVIHHILTLSMYQLVPWLIERLTMLCPDLSKYLKIIFIIFFFSSFFSWTGL